MKYPTHKACGGEVFKGSEGQWFCSRCTYSFPVHDGMHWLTKKAKDLEVLNPELLEGE